MKDVVHWIILSLRGEAVNSDRRRRGDVTESRGANLGLDEKIDEKSNPTLRRTEVLEGKVGTLHLSPRRLAPDPEIPLKLALRPIQRPHP